MRWEQRRVVRDRETRVDGAVTQVKVHGRRASLQPHLPLCLPYCMCNNNNNAALAVVRAFSMHGDRCPAQTAAGDLEEDISQHVDRNVGHRAKQHAAKKPQRAFGATAFGGSLRATSEVSSKVCRRCRHSAQTNSFSAGRCRAGRFARGSVDAFTEGPPCGSSRGGDRCGGTCRCWRDRREENAITPRTTWRPF
ncbi:unnamed protein product [Lampetra planeri]